MYNISYICMYILYLKYSNALILVFFVFTARSGAVVFLLEVNQPCLKIRIVSMPCWELFDEQDQEYQELRMASWQLSWRLNALSIGSIDFEDIWKISCWLLAFVLIPGRVYWPE